MVTTKRAANRVRLNSIAQLGGPLQIEYRPPSELIARPKRPRLHEQRQIKQLRASIRQFGFCFPVAVDAANTLIAGHARVLAAIAEGLDEVPVIRLEHLSEAEANALMIADNRLAEHASWDKRLLGEVLQDLSLLDLNFSLEITGFSMAEIDFAIEGLSIPDPNSTRDDELPGSGLLVSKAGDLWLLGKHRLLCASALESASFRMLMNEQRAAMVFTDPPYNVRIPGHASGNGRHQHPDFVMASGEMTKDEFTDFLLRFCRNVAAVSADGAVLDICMDWRHIGELSTAGTAVFGDPLNICIWVKSSPGMGSFYRSQHEFIFIFKKGKGRHRNNIALGKFGRNRSNVWQYAGINNFGRGSEEGNLLAMHPTVKPVALVADALLDASARDDIVLDPFLGSGTTIIAAEKAGRRCYGLELDPHYVDVAVRRWQKWTGENATHAGSNKNFAEIEAEVKKNEQS